jgi:hypothetical protein
MEGVNGHEAGTGARTPIPAVATAAIEQPLTSGNGSKPKRAAKASRVRDTGVDESRGSFFCGPVLKVLYTVRGGPP